MSLTPKRLLGTLIGYGHNSFLFAGYAQNVYNVECVAAADVVDDCAIFDFVDSQFLITHIVSTYKAMQWGQIRFYIKKVVEKWEL